MCCEPDRHPIGSVAGLLTATALLCITLLAVRVATCTEFAPRSGFVTLQFDDTHDLDYTHVFPILEEHGFKGSFGYITESSDLGIEGEAWKIQEMFLAGHEIQDHTTRHTYVWATLVDTLDDGVDDWIEWTFATVAQWDSLCQRSLDILDSLGIDIVGWNHPGGSSSPGTIPGHPDWMWRGSENDSLYQLIGSRYPYAIGDGVFANTAHLNLRGHNCPDRYPFFNVPHTTIDDRSLAEIKTGIADAAASGLWYVAVSHMVDLSRVAKVESLVEWLDAKGIEVVTCCEGWERVCCGHPDPLANQIPQAAMICDLDENGKPDGFTGSCSWDTVTAVPVANAACLEVSGDTHFYCYGPEVGTSSFSVWLKSSTGSPCLIRIIWTKIDFDWQILDECWTTAEAQTEWALIDTSDYATLLITVEDEVDRIRFTVRPVGPDSVLIAHPELLLVPEAGLKTADHIPAAAASRLRVIPNPVCAGVPLWIASGGRIGVYDAMGRCLTTSGPDSRLDGFYFCTSRLGPGVLFIRDLSGRQGPAKVIVYR